MARTRAGLSGRPTCRPGVICPGLSAPQGWPLAAMSAGLPVGTLRPCLTSGLRAAMRGKCRASFCYLAAGQPVMPSCLGCWFWLSCRLGAALLPVLAVVAVPPCAACRASKTVMAVGHPFMGRGGRRRWGNPEGVPRSQTALRRFVFRRRSSYPRFLVFQLQVIFIGKKLEEHLTGLGGVRSNAKRGVRSNADNALGGVRSNALGGGDLTWINQRIHRVSPQVGPVFDAFQGAFRW